MKDILIKALKRAGHTAAQTALGMITVGLGFHEIDWIHVISVTAVAVVCSLLKSFAIGMPEVEELNDIPEEPEQPEVVFVEDDDDE